MTMQLPKVRPARRRSVPTMSAAWLAMDQSTRLRNLRRQVEQETEQERRRYEQSKMELRQLLMRATRARRMADLAKRS